jgi:ABC-2 type transport system ATP-binding protein
MTISISSFFHAIISEIVMVIFSHLTKTYEKRKVIDDFSLTVNAPIFGFLGQNGAGKTTIMKMMVGLLTPTAGTIMIDGKPSSSNAAKKKMGYMPETPYFYERMSGEEFLKFSNELDGHTPSKRQLHYDTLLKRMGIFDAKDRKIGTYSKGMRQRLGFAQALVNDPEYLFLDEPLDGLDPIGRREMKAVMRELKEEGRKIFLNTHILADVEEVCDEVGVIHRGALLYAGDVKKFCDGKPLEERFVSVVTASEATS